MTLQLDHYRLLGRSGLRVSPLSLGTMTFGTTGGWGTEPDDAKKMVDLFMERGGNFIDTANYYGDSEKWLAKLIEGRRGRLGVSHKISPLQRSRGTPTPGEN